MRLTALAPVTLATLLTLSQGAYAQSQTAQPAPTPPSDAPAAQDPNAEGDIIVTAQKKSENLRDVPIAISAIKGQDLTARGFTTSMDLPDLVPGVRSTTPGGGAYVTTIIRGVGQQDNDRGGTRNFGCGAQTRDQARVQGTTFSQPRGYVECLQTI